MSEERKIALAARMYECRKTARNLVGDKYDATVLRYRDAIQAAISRGYATGPLDAVTAVVTRAEKSGMDTGMLTLWLTAAALEEIEAREPEDEGHR